MAWKVIDVSRYQGTIDFVKVKNSGVDGVIFRAGVGKYSNGALQEDSRFVEYITACNRIDLPAGMYYFSQAVSEADARKEADFLIERAKKYETKLPLVFDLENEGRIVNVSKEQNTKNAIAFCVRVKEAGYNPVVYSFKNFLETRIDQKAIKNAGYDRWIAHYTSYPHPEYESEYVMWQYTSSGSVSGIVGSVDINHCYDNYFDGGGTVKFVPRKSAPSTTDKNWIKTTYGGYNHAIAINTATGEVIPNCTGYVHGRWLELGLPENKLCLNNASAYYGYRDGFNRGSTPKLGAIICWGGGSYSGAGHVAVVEEIFSDGTVLASQSNYKGTRFYTMRINPKTWPGGAYYFQGYIYSPIDFEGGGDDPPVPTGDVGKPVARDTSRDQAEVIVTSLRARSRPELTDAVILGFTTPGVYYLLDEAAVDIDVPNTSNGYYWYKLADAEGREFWVARGAKGTSEVTTTWTKKYPKTSYVYDTTVYNMSEKDMKDIVALAEKKGLNYKTTQHS